MIYFFPRVSVTVARCILVQARRYLSTRRIRGIYWSLNVKIPCFLTCVPSRFEGVNFPGIAPTRYKFSRNLVYLVRGKVRVSEQFHTFYPGTPNRNVVGGREKCLHANQTTQRPFRDANDECQPTGAGRGAHLALLGAALGLLRLATRGG